MVNLLRVLGIGVVVAVAGCSGGDKGITGPDAGSPLGAADAAGLPDATIDTERPDAQVPDAALPDAALPDETLLGLGNVYGVPNLDDDDDDGTLDWYQSPFEAENDYSTIALPSISGHRVHLELSGDTGKLRIWNSADDIILGDTGESELTTATIDLAVAAELRVEFGPALAHGQLQAVLIDSDDAEVEVLEVDLWASPMILNHHLQPAEHVYVTAIPDDNDELVAGYQSVLTTNFSTAAGSSFYWDRWMQDELEFATSTGDQGQRMNTVIDSIRNRGLDDFPETFEGPDYYVNTWGNGGPNSQDSFGNLEVTPPVTVDGVHYPFGRIYYGRYGNQGPVSGLRDFVASQKVQAPFQIDSTWLCVGHVDEFSSWIPDPSSALGYKLLIANVPAALAIIDGIDPDEAATMELPLYDAHGFGTVRDMQTDAGLRADNWDIQDDYLTPITNRFKEETGITDDDIILIPALFESLNDCGGLAAALIPGTVNLVIANDPAGKAHLFLPDPFFRNTTDKTQDPFIRAFDALLPDNLETHYLDDWYSYHELLGEVHCGTNVERSPTAQWWDTAMHLLEAAQ